MILYGAAVLLAALSGVPGLLLKRRGGEVAAALLGLAAVAGLTASAHTLLGGREWWLALPRSPLGTAGLLHFDAIAAFFLVPVLLLPACGALFGVAYWDDGQESARRVRLNYGFATAFLAILVAASHAFTFLLAWEGMALTAFFLVIAEDRKAEVRQAGWIYLIATHSGTLCLFAAFGLMAAGTGSFAFTAFPVGFAASGRGLLALLLFLLGFGIKAGVVPLHFWLPPAHAAAPSHVSAFMSGVFIKMGILGLVRLLAWIPDPPLWLGECLVILGALSGVLGVAFALGQHDLKRLLAYHSIENIGIILLGLGLGTLGRTLGSPVIQVLGYAGGLFHVLNHGLFKGLLFLDAGALVHAMGTREVDRMGGLQKSMPVTAGTFLVGAWAICGLPPLNGFASEWLIYLGAFQGLTAVRLPLAIVAIAALALIGALALACFAKAYGTIFLGMPRRPDIAEPHEAARPMRTPLYPLASACVVLGLAPILMLPVLNAVARNLGGGAGLPGLGPLSHLGFLTVLGAVLLFFGVLGAWWVRGSVSRCGLPTWDCGYAQGNPRIQYTASSFADGLVTGLRFALWPRIHWRRLRGLFPTPKRFESHVPDPVLDRFGAPALGLTAWGLGFLRFFQSGQLPLYLLYVFLTLIALLVWMVV
jgi:hydrogenase-4 component B